METEKLNINFAEGEAVKEIIIREVGNVVEDKLPVLEPEKLCISGNITAPYAFLEKRWNAADGQINHSRTFLTVDRDNLIMKLVTNENDKRNCQVVRGEILLSRQYRCFGINSGKTWEPFELGKLLQMNRSCFEKKEEGMALVNLFKRFTAKISTAIEREEKNNGSVTDNYSKVVDSNLPDGFMVRIPIYKGAPAESVKVEVVAHVEERHAVLELISPDAQAIVEECRDKLFDEQIGKIRELAPEIPVIEV